MGFDHQEWRSTTDIWSDAEAEAVEYVDALVEFAVKYHDVDEDDLDELSDITDSGTGHSKTALRRSTGEVLSVDFRHSDLVPTTAFEK